MKATLLVTFAIASVLPVVAHDWHRHEDPQFAALQPLTLAEAEIIAEESRATQLAVAIPANTASAVNTPSVPSGGASFEAVFAPFAPKVRTRCSRGAVRRRCT